MYIYIYVYTYYVHNISMTLLIILDICIIYIHTYILYIYTYLSIYVYISTDLRNVVFSIALLTTRNPFRWFTVTHSELLSHLHSVGAQEWLCPTKKPTKSNKQKHLFSHPKKTDRSCFFNVFFGWDFFLKNQNPSLVSNPTGRRAHSSELLVVRFVRSVGALQMPASGGDLGRGNSDFVSMGCYRYWVVVSIFLKIFTPTCGNDRIWLIFFKRVETTN